MFRFCPIAYYSHLIHCESMKTILVTVHLEPSTRAIPLASACLKAMVSDHEVGLLNCYLSQSPEDIGEDILKEAPSAVGFSVYLWNRPLVIEIIKYIKEKCPGIRVLAGGPEVTAGPLNFLNSSDADIAMEGEGELTISPLLDAISKNKEIPALPGIWTSTLRPEYPAYCQDFNALPSPLLTGALNLSENPGLLWELSRGCPFACDFCFESKGTKKTRALSSSRIIRELEMIRDHEIEQVFVLDPTFNADKKRVLEILELIREYTPHTYYYFEARSEFIDEESAEAFSRIPCTLQIGLQSSSPSVLSRVNRSLDPLAFREKMDILSRRGVSFGLDLIYGLPGDTLEGFKESLNYSLSLEPNHLDLFPLSVLPGTVLYDNAEALGLIHLPSDPYTILETAGLSREDMKKAKALSESGDELYNSGGAVSWLRRACHELDKTAVELVEAWQAFRKDLVFSGETLQEYILLFLKEEYAGAEREEEYRIIRDLIRFLEIQTFMEELPESSSSPLEGVILDGSTTFSLHSSVRIEKFGMSPSLLIQCMEEGADNIVQYLNKEDEVWLLWSREWEFCHERIDSNKSAILKQLEKPVRICDLSIPGELNEQIENFLLEAVLEGYVRAG